MMLIELHLLHTRAAVDKRTVPLKKRVRVASSLDVSDYKQLEQIARRLDEPVSMVVRRLLRDAILEKNFLGMEQADEQAPSDEPGMRD